MGRQSDGSPVSGDNPQSPGGFLWGTVRGQEQYPLRLPWASHSPRPSLGRGYVLLVGSEMMLLQAWGKENAGSPRTKVWVWLHP